MTKQERELRAQAELLKTEARNLVAEGKMTDAKAKADEAKSLIEKADLLAQLEAEHTEGTEQKGEAKDKKEIEDNYKNSFFKAFRRQKLTAEDREAIEVYAGLTGGDMADGGEDGGLLVPQDIQTAINTYMRDLPQLQPLINVVPVSTLSGSRVFEKIATMTPFANITDDTADIDEMLNPQFEQITYAIKKYAGWMPIPNDLLKDSDQNIIAYLTSWIGKKSVVTRNTLILAILNAITPTAFADYKAIKKALNVTLDPMLSVGAKILTNQDGFQYLDTLEDGTGKPILQVDITQPSQKLFAGKPIVVVSNSVLPTTGTSTKKAPIFVGNFGEAVTMFERQGYQIDSTNVGGTAFRKDRTELRVIEREDVKAIDTEAVVHGTIDVTSIL